MQGLLGRPDWELMRSLPLAQVPCGSGNALAASAGMWSVATAVHAVVKGRVVPLDIASGQAQYSRKLLMRCVVCWTGSLHSSAAVLLWDSFGREACSSFKQLPGQR
jgi:hypothetical protein